MTALTTDQQTALLEEVFAHQTNAEQLLTDAAALGGWADAYGLPEGPARACYHRASEQLHEAAAKLALLAGDSELPTDAELDHLLAQLHPNRRTL